MDERTTGIILRTRPLTETSVIVHWLTQDFGRIATVAKGARRPKSPFIGKLDLFYLADFTFYQSRRGDLHTLREVSVRAYRERLRSNMAFLEQACYLVQLLELSTETNTPLPRLFGLTAATLDAVATSGQQILAIHAFEMKLLIELGLEPDLRDSKLTAGAIEILGRLAHADWESLLCLRVSRAQAEELDGFLGRFILYHFGRIPKGRPSALSHA